MTQVAEKAQCILRKDVVILISEDDSGHFLLAKRFLRKQGLENEIIWLEDGRETIDFLFNQGNGQHREEGKKYILLLDIRMPGIDGIKVLEKIKKDEKLREMPVIMLTTSDDKVQAELCYELGCEAHIVKPPTQVLIKAIQRFGAKL